eukprot:2291919-Pleurochrysis_carterae.AAC.2
MEPLLYRQNCKDETRAHPRMPCHVIQPKSLRNLSTGAVHVKSFSTASPRLLPRLRKLDDRPFA